MNGVGLDRAVDGAGFAKVGSILVSVLQWLLQALLDLPEQMLKAMLSTDRG